MKNRNTKPTCPPPVKPLVTNPAPPPANHTIFWIQTALFLTVSLIFLSASFMENALNVGMPGQFANYQPAGKTSFIATMVFSSRHGLMSNCGLMFIDSIRDVKQSDLASTNVPAETFRKYVYTSQPTFHRVVYSAIYGIAGGGINAFFANMERFTAFMLALAISIFALIIVREFGWIAGIVVVLLSACSDWLVFVARSPYDAYFLKLTPFLATWLLYPRVLDRRMRFSTLAIIVGGLVFLNAASVYEFIVSVIMGASVGIVYHGIKQNISLRTITKHVVAVTVAGVAAFLIVLCLHVIQVSCFEGSLQAGFERIWLKAAARTYGPTTNFYGATDPYADSCPPNVSAFMLLQAYSMLKAISIPFAGEQQRIYLTFFSLFMLSWPFFPFALMDAQWFSIVGRKRRLLLGLAAALAISLVGTLMWPLMAKGRMYHHMHLDSIGFYLTFVLVLYAALGAAMSTMLEEAKLFVRTKLGRSK
jgi:hypothetical protein